MAHKCGTCGSADTSTGLHTYTCLSCGASTSYEESNAATVTATPRTPEKQPAKKKK